MLFTSLNFGLLTSLTFLLYYFPGSRRYQKSILILASFIFYGYEQPSLLILLVISIGVSGLAARGALTGDLRQARVAASIGILLNLGFLSLFKYGPLISRTFFSGSSPDSAGHLLATLPLPVGISFFTFQGISLVVDAFRSRTTDELRVLRSSGIGKYCVDIALFKSFFPQLVAGPIVKAHEFIPQIETKLFHKIDWEWCFRKLVLGYFLKLVIADNLKHETFWISYPYFLIYPGWKLAQMLVGYSVQIFSDFAGYSFIAMGVAGLFGYRLPINFNFPYIARTFSDFWRRWHISLSSFLREYLYIPLGGSKNGALLTYFNLFLVMFLGGLWHGSSWSYAIWGTAHGVALAVERFLRPRVTLPDTLAVRCGQRLFVFAYVSLAWVLFRLTELDHIREFSRALLSGWQEVRFMDLAFSSPAICLLSLPVVGYHAWGLAGDFWRHRIQMRIPELSYGVMLFMMVTNSGSPGAFIYFQF